MNKNGRCIPGEQLLGFQGWRVRSFSGQLQLLELSLRSILSRMKNICLVVVLLAMAGLSLKAQTSTTSTTDTNSDQGGSMPDPTPFSVVQRDGNSRIWQRETYEQLPDGTVVPHVHRVTELATGLNYKNAQGEWLDSKEEIQILAEGGAAATNGAHQVYFPVDIYSGAIKLVTPEGLILQGHPIGLSYDDGEKSVLIAEVTNSVGAIVGANQVIYSEAFTGNGIKADVRYTYRRGGLEQDIILETQPPTPESLGLNPETARLQVLTEFFDAPEPTVENRTLPASAGVDLQDEALGFGIMKMVPGRAFLAGGEAGTDDENVWVTKRWIETDGRQILVEEVPVDVLADRLATLPVSAKVEVKTHVLMASHKLALPAKHFARLNDGGQHMLVAKNATRDKGLILDYNIINANVTDYTFQGDTTYYITGGTWFYGTTTIEGGAVLKYANTNNATVLITGPFQCETAPYRPAIFTSKDDNSVGDAIPGSTGSPVTQLNSLGLQYYTYYYTNSGPLMAHDLQMRYINTGIQINNFSTTNVVTNNVWDCQIKSTTTAFATSAGVANYFNLHNVLVQGANVAFLGYGPLVLGWENLTIHNVHQMYYSGDGLYVPLGLTNCLLIGVTNWGITFTGNTCATNSSDAGIFQIVGDGGNYLANGSPYRNAGTPNISPELSDDLATKTTYPPIVYAGSNFITPLSLSPQVPRDTNANPDLGYHYYPLDYVFGGCVLSTNLTCAAGTAVGFYEASGSVSASGQPYGICLTSGANLALLGTATAPCWDTSYNMVQEGGNGNWTGRGYMGGIVLDGATSSNLPQINNQFAKWSCALGMSCTWRDNLAYGVVNSSDSEFYAGTLAGFLPSMYFTNCLFFRDDILFYDQVNAASFAFKDCTFYNGGFVATRTSGQSFSFWRIQDTAFDGTAFLFTDNDAGGTNNTYFNYNSYNTNNLSWQTYAGFSPQHGTLETIGSNDLRVANYNWESSWLGDFYLPTNSPLINAGSTNANLIGLYHFTTQTNQIVEGDSIVDIGYHYVATDGYGNPLDSNGDGIPDYLEDANGNGLFDAGDLGEWQISPYGLNSGNALQVFTPLK